MVLDWSWSWSRLIMFRIDSEPNWSWSKLIMIGPDWSWSRLILIGCGCWLNLILILFVILLQVTHMIKNENFPSNTQFFLLVIQKMHAFCPSSYRFRDKTFLGQRRRISTFFKVTWPKMKTSVKYVFLPSVILQFRPFCSSSYRFWDKTLWLR